MKTLSLPLTAGDIDTRKKRRRVCAMISAELLRIGSAEEAYMKRIPENMIIGRSRHFLYARRASDDLFDAYLIVGEAFEPF
jgi:hypothetical protein